DLDAFVALLREDAVLRMPPWREWYVGRAAIRAFFAWAWSPPGAGPGRLGRTAATGQPAFAQDGRGPHGPASAAHALWLPTLQDGAMAVLTGFVEPRLLAGVRRPAVLRAHACTPGA